MQRPLTILRSTLAVLAGLLLAGVLAAPAAAEHPEYAPTPFKLQDVGEDYCTFFNTAGEAAWPSVHEPTRPSVDVTGEGWISYAPPDTICLAVDPFPRHILFTAHVDREPVASHVEPFDRIDGGFPSGRFLYEFSLAAPDGAPIDYLTVAMCYTQHDDIGQGAHCDEPVVLTPGAGVEER